MTLKQHHARILRLLNSALAKKSGVIRCQKCKRPTLQHNFIHCEDKYGQRYFLLVTQVICQKCLESEKIETPIHNG